MAFAKKQKMGDSLRVWFKIFSSFMVGAVSSSERVVFQSRGMGTRPSTIWTTLSIQSAVS